MPGWQVNSSWRVTRIGNLSASFLIYAKIDGQKSAGRRICLRHRRSGGNGRQVRFLSVLVFGLVDRISAFEVLLMLGSACLAEQSVVALMLVCSSSVAFAGVREADQRIT